MTLPRIIVAAGLAAFPGALRAEPMDMRPRAYAPIPESPAVAVVMVPVKAEALTSPAAAPATPSSGFDIRALFRPTVAPSAPEPAVTAAPTLPAGGVRALIAKHATEHGVPVPLADAMVKVESTYNPRARNGVNIGLTQISFRTARSMGYSGGVAGLLDADTNLRFGIKYLAQAYQLAGGDTCRTVLKYQAGHRAVGMTRAASAYCAKVKAHVAAVR